MAARRGRPCGPVLMRELATMPRGMCIRPNASSPRVSRLSSRESPQHLSGHLFECLVGNRISIALSVMLMLAHVVLVVVILIRLNTALIAPLLVSTESVDIAVFLASIGPKLLHK